MLFYGDNVNILQQLYTNLQDWDLYISTHETFSVDHIMNIMCLDLIKTILNECMPDTAIISLSQTCDYTRIIVLGVPLY